MPKRQLLMKWIGRMIVIGVAGGLLWLVAITSLIHVTGTRDQRQAADVIVVLGAGLSHDGRPGYALTRRSLQAAELWQAGYAPTIICTGGIAPNQTTSEAAGCQRVLNWRGVPDSAILLEENSRSTEENAIYSRPLIEANDFQRVLLVSDSFHVFRARYIFASQGIDVRLSPVPRDRIRGRPSYDYFILREVAALHWQVFKDLFNIPITHIP